MMAVATSRDLAPLAVACARRGLVVVPLNAMRPDLRPFTAWKELTSPDPDAVAGWWRRWPRAGIGVRLGRLGRDVFVLDVDIPSAAKPNRADGEASLRALEAAHGTIPVTRQSRTPSGGRHIWLRAPRGVRIATSASSLGPGLDIIADGALGRLPPTTCPRGAYAWTNQEPTADAPAWLVELLRAPERPKRAIWAPSAIHGRTTPYGRAALVRACSGLASMAEDSGRNVALNREAYGIGGLVAGGEIDEAEAHAELLSAACASGLKDNEARYTLRRAFREGMARPRVPKPRTR